MSVRECPDPAVEPDPEGALEQVIVPRTSDVGGFEVARALPSAQKRLVGPFVFLDQMGPGEILRGDGLDVQPHPHIGLSTLTYLFDGVITHRDSLGTVQDIRPGAVNWMTAGAGIAHSERSPDSVRETGGRLFGLQAWVALPQNQEECAPAFSHLAQSDLPLVESPGLLVRLVAGELFGQRSPLATASETLYADIELAAGISLPLESRVEERALYIVSGSLLVDRREHPAGRLLVIRPGETLTVQARQDCRFVLLGGEPMDGPRHVWWNFVSSSRDRIEQAKADWKAGRFDRVIDDNEYIPLPER
ncbi:MAG: pirin family protein [Wenzhouxiangella sp.]